MPDDRRLSVPGGGGSPSPPSYGPGNVNEQQLVHLSRDSDLPPYEQIRSQIAAQIEEGRLVSGERLPSIRALAEALGVAPGTTARAYAHLEAAGLVESRARHGTRVVGPESARTAVAERAQDFIAAARQAGLDQAGAAAIIEKLWHP